MSKPGSLLAAGERELVTTGPAVDPFLAMCERIARDPEANVDKLERLLAMQEHVMAVNREAAFEAAFAKMQPEIPVIDEKGRIEVRGTVRSTYAPLEDIHEVIKPILARHGFSMRHKTEWPADKPGIIRIVGILGHEQGHKERTEFEAKADASDFRSDIQSQGSTVSYGRRYTTLDLLNIATRKQDKDGQKPGNGATEAPTGFETWWDDFQATADNGLPALEAAWKASKSDFKIHASKTKRDALNSLKKKAGTVVAS